MATLKQLPLLRGLSRAELETARAVVSKRVVETGASLMGEDEAGASLFFVVEGTFKITVRKGESVVLLGLCGRGEVLGELAAIDGHTRSATVTAQTTCVVGELSATHFWNALWPLEPVPVNMALLLVGRVRRLTAKVQAMATLDVRGRLAYQLVSLARDHGAKRGGTYHIPFGLKQLELAQMVGTSRVQVNQLMLGWSKQGLLSAQRNGLTIHNLPALCALYPRTLETAPFAPRQRAMGSSA